MKNQYGLSSCIAFPDETRNYAASSVLCVQRVTQFLASGVILLFKSKGLKNLSIPFILKSVQNSRDRRLSGWSRSSGLGVYTTWLVKLSSKRYASQYQWCETSKLHAFEENESTLTSFNGYQVRLLQFFAREWICAIVGNVL